MWYYLYDVCNERWCVFEREVRENDESNENLGHRSHKKIGFSAKVESLKTHQW